MERTVNGECMSCSPDRALCLCHIFMACLGDIEIVVLLASFFILTFLIRFGVALSWSNVMKHYHRKSEHGWKEASKWRGASEWDIATLSNGWHSDSSMCLLTSRYKGCFEYENFCTFRWKANQCKMASKGITFRHAEFNLPLIASRGMFLIYLLANVNMCESMLVRPI